MQYRQLYIMRTDVNPRFQCGLGNIRIVHNLDFVQIMQRLIINLLSIIENSSLNSVKIRENYNNVHVHLRRDVLHFFPLNVVLPSILKTHFQEKSVVAAGSSPVILARLKMR